MRVHGAGDHGVFSALGRPIYVGTGADRVRIGSLPDIPQHELKLINWSRPSRRITRTLSWYSAYPFTLVNMAGFMGPERTGERAERRLWWLVRTAVVMSSLVMTFAMATWLTAIVETAWRLLDAAPRGPGAIVMGAFAPGLLAGAVLIRLLRGRPLVDRGNRRVAVLTLVVLVGAAGCLSARTVGGDGLLGVGLTHDPMSLMVAGTTLVAWSHAGVLCLIGWRTGRAGLAGAGILIAFAIAILHTAGSAVRLLVHTVLKYTPPVIERRVQSIGDSSRVLTQSAADAAVDRMLPIDVIPLLFVMMAAVFAALVWREYRCRRPVGVVEPTRPRLFRLPSPGHLLLRDTPQFLGRLGFVGILASLALWTVVFGVTAAAVSRGAGADDLLAFLVIALKIAGLLLVVAVVVRRPEHAVLRIKHVLESLADVAGFWAPDLHPLAGASYRLAVLHGLRRGVREVRKESADRPIALVGHSQGAVICAWFVRGGHWQERSSENVSDEDALAMRLHPPSPYESDRIALFTCGSPIGSLYRTFFPRYFDDSFLETAAKKSDGFVWHNYWRATDPIGARLGHRPRHAGAEAGRVRDVDVTELADEPTKGHCEYWQDGRVRQDIEAYFASCAAADADRQGAVEVGKPGRLRSLKAAFPRLHLPRN
jgi:hypothetical protein